MISKFSVKKPYTVFVAVIAVIVIGIVAVTKMTMDLLPNMTLPYVVVITVDPGASPAEVEQKVTAPLEATLATTSNLKNMQSVSRNSYSTIILEYEQTSNMDSTMIEIQQGLDQVKGTLGDGVAAPMVMQLNPDMIPVMVAAVTIEGSDSIETGDYVKSDVVPQLEGVEGVASVTASGNVEETVQVTLNQKKIDKLNEKIKKAIDDQFLDAEAEINKNKADLESGKAELESGKNQMAGQLASGKAELDTQKTQLYATSADMDQNLMVMEAGKGILEQIITTVNSLTGEIAEIKAQIESFRSLISLVDDGIMTAEQFAESVGMDIEAARARVTELRLQLIDKYEELRTAVEPVAEQYGINLDGLSQSILDQARAAAEEAAQNPYVQKAGEVIEETQQKIDETGEMIQETGETLLEAGESFTSEADKRFEELEAMLDVQPIVKLLSEALTKLNVGIETIKSAQDQIKQGKLQISQAEIMLNKNEVLGELKIAEAQSQIMMGEAGLTQAESAVDQAKEDAKAAADLNNILSLDTVNGLLIAQNFDMPAGYAGGYLIRVGEDIPDVESLQDLVLIDLGMDGIDVIRLSDIADVEKVNNADSVYAKVNGEAALLLTFEKQTGYSTGDVTDNIIDRFGVLERNLDKPVKFSILMDQGVYIDIIVKSIAQNMLLGAGLAIIILIIFLRDIKPTIIIACAIPISVIFAVVLMYFTGITLNIISMSGLTLGIGMLVDNSIVVIENIFRLRKEEGMSVKKASVYGASQVAGAITASTLTTICVFLPIVFTEGLTRQLFVDMGLTIAYTLTASLVVALTLVPAMAQGLLRKSKEKGTGRGRFYDVFGRFVGMALKFKVVVFLIVIGALALSVWLSISKGTAFFPEMTSTQITVTLSVPEDEERSFEEMTGYADILMDRVQNIESVNTVGAMMGSGSLLGSLDGGGGDDVTMYVLLDENTKFSNDEISAQIMSYAEDLDCDVSVNTNMMDMSMMTGSGVKVQIKGRDLDKLAELAEQVAEEISDIDGIEKVDAGLGDLTDELFISVDKVKAAEYGMTVAQVFTLVSAELSDTKSMTSISTDVKDLDIYVNTDDQAEVTINDIEKLTFEYTDKISGETETVPLSRIVTFTERKETSSISRDAQVRYLEVSAELKDGYNVGLVGSDVKEAIKKMDIPEGYSIKTTGEDETINEAMRQVLLMLLLAVILIYLIMVAQFQSLLSPFIIMFTIPLAFTGGFAALFFANKELSIIAMVGFVMLSGIIVNNGIVLVDYINQLRREGMAKRDAIIEASKTRLRPVFMTALTTIISMSTMAAGMGQGTEMSQPMAIVVVGGMIYGTLLTLVVVPCIYDALNRERDMREEDLDVPEMEESDDDFLEEADAEEE